MLIDMQEYSLTADPKATIENFEAFGTCVCQWQRGANWWLGDLARMAARRFPDTWMQVFPESMSPDHIARCRAVAEAYSAEERNPLASWTIHMRESKKPNRVALVQAHVEAGHTSDQAAKKPPETKSDRWLLVMDVNYFLHKTWASGAGNEAAKNVSDWVHRIIHREKVGLKAKGLTDFVCCFDSPSSHRKELTVDWEDGYKSKRTHKDPELIEQLKLVRELLDSQGACSVSVDGMEGDDCMTSYAATFPGRVTLLNGDKDLRQALSETCNILTGTDWEDNDHTGEKKLVYNWITAKSHAEKGFNYNGVHVTGITPAAFIEFQIIAGDPVDGIGGVASIGAKTAADLIHLFGDVASVIQAAKDEDERITEKKRAAIIEFEPRAEITRKLVTLRTDLKLPMTTRINSESTSEDKD